MRYKVILKDELPNVVFFQDKDGNEVFIAKAELGQMLEQTGGSKVMLKLIVKQKFAQQAYQQKMKDTLEKFLMNTKEF